VAQQQLHDLGVAQQRGNVQRRVACRIERVGVDARRREQQRDLPPHRGGDVVTCWCDGDHTNEE